MTNVILVGKKTDKRISNLFFSSLSQRCRIVDTSDTSSIGDASSADFLLWHSAGLKSLNAKSSVLIFKGFPEKAPDLSFAPDTVAIVDSQNEAVIEAVAKSRIKAVTCGLSARDTITLSSLTQDSAVVSLQRPVNTFSGHTLEPFEIPVKLARDRERYSILSICAALLLSGRQDLLDGLLL